MSLTEHNERVYFNLGMLAMDDRNTEEAEHFFRRAIHIKQDFRSALFNLALLLADDHRPLEAAPFLNQLVKYHPDHVKGLILLGDIYINNLKDIDAAESVSWKLFFFLMLKWMALYVNYVVLSACFIMQVITNFPLNSSNKQRNPSSPWWWTSKNLIEKVNFVIFTFGSNFELQDSSLLF